MSEFSKDRWQALVTMRDELRVQIHLAGSEVKDEWDELENQWSKVESNIEHLVNDAGHKAQHLNSKLQVIGEELSAAYQRIQQRLKEHID